ncbi:hypothetical protein F2Q68_00010316 [Brassica cretica]|uniref:Uncharacterized protein n=1 Tax=Brassica cretica TaxID=69181 RepID=A0A8S9L3Z6_BRACR|nr:hypothetical protein F2Q68_00010316 [Brassica cretica]
MCPLSSPNALERFSSPNGCKVQTGQSTLHRIRLAAPLSIRSSCPVRSLEPQSNHLSSLNPSLQHLVSELKAPE